MVIHPWDQFLRPEEGKYYESRDVRFNEKLVYQDKFVKNSIKDFPQPNEDFNKEKWFVQFDNESVQSDKGENELAELSKTEIKRKRGRPRKSETEPKKAKSNKVDETVNDNSFDNLQIDEKLKTSALFTNLRHGEIETEIDQTNDEVFHAMLANINSDLLNYKDAMHTKDNKLWQDAIDDELRSMKKNKVWKLNVQF